MEGREKKLNIEDMGGKKSNFLILHIHVCSFIPYDASEQTLRGKYEIALRVQSDSMTSE